MNRLKWLLPALLILAALIILSASGRKANQAGPVALVAMEATGPIENLITSTLGGVENFWRNYLNLVAVRAENRRLKELTERQAGQIVQLTEYKAANERLVRFLNFKTANPDYDYLAAKVLAWDPGPWFRSVVLNVGSNDGVAADQPVVHYQGVVGRVVTVSPHYSKVLLATDFNSSVDAFIQRTRGPGLLAGQGDRPFALKYVRKDEDVRLGDLVVTSGLDGVFPSGLVLGTVSFTNKKSADMFVEAEVSPAVNFGQLEEAMVILNARPQVDWLTLAPKLRPFLESDQ